MVSVRATLETTHYRGTRLVSPFARATTSALRHLGWWLDWHARARPTDGCRESD
jgi:hypothetical protein